MQAGAVGQHQRADQVALVFGGNETAGHGAEHEDAAAHDDRARDGADDAVVQGLVHHRGVGLGEGLEEAVEGAEDRRLLVLALQQQRAQGRGEGEGDDAGEGHRDGHRDGELLVELAGDAAEEGHRDEHRAQHQHDRHHGARHLAHRLDGGGVGRHLLFPHQALDVLEHHDGVIDDDADRQHHCEQGEGVDREAEQPQAGEGADQRHRHGDQRDQCGTPVLEEQEDHRGHQQQGFAEGADDLLDRGLDELGGVEGHHVVDAGGELLLQLVHPGAHFVRHFERVGAGLQEDAHAHHRLAEQRGAGVVVLGAELDPGHVLDAQHATRAGGADDDVAELLGGGQAPLGGDGVHQLLAGGGRLLADLPGGVLAVLGGDGVGDIGGRDAQLGHAVRLQPQADRVVEGTEDLGVTHARDALEVVDDVDQRVVGQEQRRPAGIRRGQRGDHQDVVGALLHRHAKLAHHVGQARFGNLDPVIDVDGGHVDVGADLEGRGDRQAAVGRGAGVEVEQVLDARELLLDGAGHRPGEGFGGGAGVGGGDHHRRRGDLGVLGDRQRTRGHQAGDHDDDRDDRREDRPVDEET